MRIVFVTPYAPGYVRVRSFNLIRQLLSHEHQVTLVHPRWSDDRQSRVTELEAEGARVVSVPMSRARGRFNLLLGALRPGPIQVRHAWSPTLARRLSREVSSAAPDIVHFEHLRSVPYARRVAADRASAGIARVWDGVDCISGLLSQTQGHSGSWSWRLAARLELAPTRRYERAMAPLFERICVASDVDLEALAEVTGSTVEDERLAVLPSGVDLGAFPYRDPGERRQQVVFNGALSYHPNADAALYLVEEVMPLVWASRPQVPVVIIGPSPPRALRGHARRNPRIRVTGWVSSVQSHLVDAAVAAIPLRYGAGMQSKVLEAMACGTPIVTDPRSADAVGARDDRELLTAATAPEFAEAILRLLDDPALRRRLAGAARERVEREFTWDRAARELELQYQEAVANRSRMC